MPHYELSRKLEISKPFICWIFFYLLWSVPVIKLALDWYTERPFKIENHHFLKSVQKLNSHSIFSILIARWSTGWRQRRRMRRSGPSWRRRRPTCRGYSRYRFHSLPFIIYCLFQITLCLHLYLYCVVVSLYRSVFWLVSSFAVWHAAAAVRPKRTLPITRKICCRLPCSLTR